MKVMHQRNPNIAYNYIMSGNSVELVFSESCVMFKPSECHSVADETSLYIFFLSKIIQNNVFS